MNNNPDNRRGSNFFIFFILLFILAIAVADGFKIYSDNADNNAVVLTTQEATPTQSPVVLTTPPVAIPNANVVSSFFGPPQPIAPQHERIYLKHKKDNIYKENSDNFAELIAIDDNSEYVKTHETHFAPIVTKFPKSDNSHLAEALRVDKQNGAYVGPVTKNDY